MPIQDPWEEKLRGVEGGRPLWGGIVKLLSSWLTGNALGTIGEGGATDVSATPTSPGQYTMTAPDISSWGAAERGQQVSGAVRMPWQDQGQEVADSFSGFFEKLNNPQSTNAFSQLVRALFGRK